MKNYDDLQRFKDKTRTGDIHFKDLSAQNKQASSSGWAIINQLAGVDSDAVLAKAGSVALRCPCRRPLSPANWMLLLPA
ncbi:cellulose biosynthesis protein BcsO [Leclercia sp. G3L]|uniref:cellulose biosynthesis protein BcsO n=1 Tax=Leclercia sp. G3L TaxID=2898725 RepID=UPI0021063C2E|nr:cellulose biosynthesis protein BcsO [Leclercia sp. G3L]